MEVEAADVKHGYAWVVRVIHLHLPRIPIEIEIPKIDRAAALELPDGLHAPAADDPIDHTVRVRGPTASPAEWQLPDPADRDALRHVGQRWPSLVLPVGRVQLGHALSELRP